MLCDQPELERWLPIINYEGYYEISNYGRVKSLPRKYSPKEKILILQKNRGYCHCRFRKNNSGETVKIHRLVISCHRFY